MKRSIETTYKKIGETYSVLTKLYKVCLLSFYRSRREIVPTIFLRNCLCKNRSLLEVKLTHNHSWFRRELLHCVNHFKSVWLGPEV